MNDYWLLLMIFAILLMNVSAFFLYRHDKRAAQKNEWRISENALLVAALLGPFGAFAAMRRYRHKTKHMKFLLVPIFMILWIVAALYTIYAWYFV
jgi:uncharacterized membrane protein YsdA (DUF1294 family)